MDTINYLVWDSDFFGRRTGRARPRRLTQALLDELLEDCRQERIECLYFLADSDDPQTPPLLERQGFRFVDVRMTFECALEGSAIGSSITGSSAQGSAQPVQVRVRPFQPGDLPALEEIARTSFTQTRFYFDPGFTRQESERLYVTWMHNSVQDYAQEVLVAEAAGEALGCLTCHHKPGAPNGEIGLLGVAAQARGQGVGRLLIENGLDWFAGRGANTVSVACQGRNVAAQRLYQRCGFLTRSVQLWYHAWFEVPSA